MILVRFYGFEVPTELAAGSDRNFKSTALVGPTMLGKARGLEAI
jgi:hypothetical protein